MYINKIYEYYFLLFFITKKSGGNYTFIIKYPLITHIIEYN